MLYSVGFGIPILFIAATEFWLSVAGHRLEAGILVLQIIIGYTLGAGSAHLLTDIGKYSVGRLRPHFFSVCNPNISTICTANHPVTQYVIDYSCAPNKTMFDNEDRTIEKALKEIHLSFPSGHATFSVQAAVFSIWYLQSRSPQLPNSIRDTFILPLIQLGLLVMAFFTCISRVMDNKHHPTDVIAGALIGTIIQLFNVAYVTKIWASVSTPAGPRMERSEVDINNGVPLQERTSNNTLL